MIEAAFFLVSFATLAALLASGYLLQASQESPLEVRLDELRTATVGGASGAVQRRASGGVSNLTLYIVSLIPGGEEWINDTERELLRAGVRRREPVALYIVFNFLFGAAVIGGLQWLVWDGEWTAKLVNLIAGGLLAWLLPRQVLYRLVARYRRSLEEALPDCVDMLGIVLGTGMALDQALLRVSEEMQHIYPGLSAEFSTVVMQVKAGQERSRAFQALVRRTGLEDIKSLAAMILQSERFGTSLSQALKVYADALRMRRRLRAEAAVGKAGIKMTVAIVIFILPAMLTIALAPGVLTALQDLRGGVGAR